MCKECVGIPVVPTLHRIPVIGRVEFITHQVTDVVLTLTKQPFLTKINKKIRSVTMLEC